LRLPIYSQGKSTHHYPSFLRQAPGKEACRSLTIRGGATRSHNSYIAFILEERKVSLYIEKERGMRNGVQERRILLVFPGNDPNPLSKNVIAEFFRVCALPKGDNLSGETLSKCLLKVQERGIPGRKSTAKDSKKFSKTHRSNTPNMTEGHKERKLFGHHPS
jgi:hypothetical protein